MEGRRPSRYLEVIDDEEDDYNARSARDTARSYAVKVSVRMGLIR